MEQIREGSPRFKARMAGVFEMIARQLFALAWATLLLNPILHAEEKCPVEIKLLLSPPTVQTVVASLGFEKETSGRVYFFDTHELDLLKQGVIVRVRQGAANDLTVKVRVAEGNKQIDVSRLREHFPCEIDRNGAQENISYSVRRKYNPSRLPEMGNDISRMLSRPQQRLLDEVGISIDWSAVSRIADITSTTWETKAQSSFQKLALELWEWPAGNVIELSAKVRPHEGQLKSAELEELVNRKGLLLSASQGTKTTTVLGDTYKSRHPSSSDAWLGPLNVRHRSILRHRKRWSCHCRRGRLPMRVTRENRIATTPTISTCFCRSRTMTKLHHSHGYSQFSSTSHCAQRRFRPS